jgi:diacylglycerol kinase family enzyme
VTRARAAAILALALLAAGGLGAVYDFIDDFPVAVILVVAFGLALWIGWAGLLRTGAARVAGLGVAGALLAVVVATIAIEGVTLGDVLVLGCLAAAVAAARVAFIVHIPLARVPPPARPTLFVNPWSGGGKAERFRVVDEARKRGYEAVELRRGDDLRELVAAAIERGADGLAMAGGDGSQAIVAAAAAERGLPYACIPSGTRNHFALDLGVDRDDVVGALDAFIDGGEHVVDLAEVNGRVFVNNVSLGVYAAAVQREGYRDAKLRTLLATIPETLGADDESLDLRWQGPGGHEHAGGAAVLVSNNRYRLGRALANATRPRIDDGLLGVTVLGAPRGRGESSRSLQRPWREWSAPTFEVESSAPVPTGIDGEAVLLTPPLRFRILAGVLRARIAASHPGASPSAHIPDGAAATLRELTMIAAGRSRPTERKHDGHP